MSTVSIGPRFLVRGRGGSTSARREPAVDPAPLRRLDTTTPSTGSNIFFHMHHSARISPTTSPRLFWTGARSSFSTGSRGAREPGRRGADRPCAAVLDLQRDAEPSRTGCAHDPVGPAFRDPPLVGAHQRRVGVSRARGSGPGEPASPPLRGHRRPVAPNARTPEPCAPARARRSRRRSRRSPSRARPPPGPRLEHPDLHRPLTRMVRQPVAAGVPAVRATEREHAGVLARAVVA